MTYTKPMYSVGEFAKLIKKSTRTLQSWDRKKKLIAQRTVTNRRYYTHAQYLSYLGFLPIDKGKIQNISQKALDFNYANIECPFLKTMLDVCNKKEIKNACLQKD